jgi:hypothetical protein
VTFQRSGETTVITSHDLTVVEGQSKFWFHAKVEWWKVGFLVDHFVSDNNSAFLGNGMVTQTYFVDSTDTEVEGVAEDQVVDLNAGVSNSFDTNEPVFALSVSLLNLVSQNFTITVVLWSQPLDLSRSTDNIGDLNITWLGWDFNNGYIKVSGSSLWTNFNLPSFFRPL